MDGPLSLLPAELKLVTYSNKMDSGKFESASRVRHFTRKVPYNQLTRIYLAVCIPPGHAFSPGAPSLGHGCSQFDLDH